MGGVPDTGPVNGQSRITLLRGIGNGRVHVAVIAVGVAQAEPVQVVLGDARHEQLDHITAVGDCDLGWAVPSCDGTIECFGNDWEGRVAVTDDGLD